jgi:Ankyrin repeats (3 copies)/Ankyrin repeat
LRIYLIGLSPRILLDESERCKAVAEEVRATDDFRHFQRLVRRDDLLQHEGLKAYVLTAFAMMMPDFGTTTGLLPPAGALQVLDQILTDSRVVPGAAVDAGFSFGRDKILAISVEGMLAILLHELGHHLFDWGMRRGSRTFADTTENDDADTDKAAPTPAVLAELATALPGLITSAQKAPQPGPQAVALKSGLGFLLSIESPSGGPYLHMSLSDHGGPISRASAGDHAFLILALIGADPEEAAAAMSPRGVFHFGVRGLGPDEREMKRRLKATDPAALLAGLRVRSAAWLDHLNTAGRLTDDGKAIPIGLGLVSEPRHYPADPTVWEDLAICQRLRAAASGVRLSPDELKRVVSAAIGAGDNELLRALLAAGGRECTVGCEDLARAGCSLGAIDDGVGTKYYVGPTPDGILAVLETLRNHGSDLNCPIDERGTTLLIAAARRAPQTAGALLSLGVDVNRANASDETPLHAAAQSGWSALVEELVAAGGSVDAHNANGATPLMEALEQDNAAAVEVLLAHGASPNATDQHGETPLMAVLTAEVAERLIGAGAEPNARDHAGATALMYAVRRGLPGVVHALLDAGADPEAAAEQGDTALHRVQGMTDLGNFCTIYGVIGEFMNCRRLDDLSGVKCKDCVGNELIYTCNDRVSITDDPI